MVRKSKAFIISLLLSCSLMIGTAQTPQQAGKTTPKWVPQKGFWVIENNINAPKTSVINFYNDNSELVYSEKVEGVRINIKRQRTCMRLKKVLDQSLLAWDKAKQPKDDRLVKNMFGIRQ